MTLLTCEGPRKASICTGSGASRIASPRELHEVCARLLREFSQPVLVETYLSGREFTAGVVGTGRSARVVGVMEVLFRKGYEGDAIYSYHSKANYEEMIMYSVPEGEMIGPCAELALASWRVLGCRDGGRVDIRMDEAGDPNFIEVNPLAGLNPVHSDLPILCRLNGIPFRELIGEILDSALKRTG